MNPIKLTHELSNRGIQIEVKSDFIGFFHNFIFNVTDDSKVMQVFHALEEINCAHWVWNGNGEFQAMFAV